MRIKRVVTLSLSFLTVFSLYQDTVAARPTDRVVIYTFHEAPDDPLSPIIQTVSIGMNVAKEYENGDTAWVPVNATIADLDGLGNEVAKWHGTDLFFDTVDGQWIINHLDPLAPADIEFDFPPLLLGTATSADPMFGPWDFEFLGELNISRFNNAGTGETTILNSEAPPGNPATDEMEDDDPDDEPYSS